MSVNLEGSNEILIAYLTGELDHHCAGAIRQKIDSAVNELKPALLVLDFGDISFMDSSGIGLIMGRYKLISSLGGTLHVVNVTEQAHRVMTLAGLESLATITEAEVKK
ncbi:MAG: anti-sigma factor antagonist [Clostridia bacterium]|nr:anti-sigma factor antagonist [Clostridia bacterium]